MSVRLRDAIATRVLSEAGSSTRYVVVLGKPRRKADMEWECRFMVHGLPGSEPERVYGIDSFQALMLAIERIRLVLASTRRRLQWEGSIDASGSDAGFPRLVPSVFGPEFAKRVDRFIDREADRVIRATRVARGNTGKKG